MGLLDKTNPRATRRSVIRHAIGGAVVNAAFILAIGLGKPKVRTLWPVLLPAFAVAGAGIGALAEWQINDDDGPDKPEKGDWGELLDV